MLVNIHRGYLIETDDKVNFFCRQFPTGYPIDKIVGAVEEFSEGKENPRTPRLVCAAVRAENGQILTGIRHYSGDMLSHIMGNKSYEKFANRSGDDQGFVDQYCRYYTRIEAWIIAEYNGQIIRRIPDRDGILFSENLY